jgi:hypothetical protein
LMFQCAFCKGINGTLLHASVLKIVAPGPCQTLSALLLLSHHQFTSSTQMRAPRLRHALAVTFASTSSLLPRQSAVHPGRSPSATVLLPGRGCVARSHPVALCERNTYTCVGLCLYTLLFYTHRPLAYELFACTCRKVRRLGTFVALKKKRRRPVSNGAVAQTIPLINQRAQLATHKTSSSQLPNSCTPVTANPLLCSHTLFTRNNTPTAAPSANDACHQTHRSPKQTTTTHTTTKTTTTEYVPP